ncbi:MAG: carboxypeptidase-like regulatory domain-containing protein [Bacteroidales bacterium]|nr:carboxypeptidase-like regulatory domain-containing protein [Bacteroidales bacterium]
MIGLANCRQYRRLLCFFIFYLLLSEIPLNAQERYFFFSGKILEQGSKRGLSNVNLSIANRRTGTVSGKKGDFSFFVDSIPAYLIISHVGYQTKSILLDETSFSLTIYLVPQISDLEEVEIASNELQPFFKDDFYSIRDYEIDSGNVFLLVYRTKLRNAEILCKNILGDTIARSEVLRFFPNRLFKDCMGYMHVLSNDSGFQLYRNDKSLQLFHPVALKKFDDVLKDCIASTSTVFYFRKMTDMGLGVEYYGIDRKTLTKYSIANVKDEKKMKLLLRNKEDIGLLWKSSIPESREEFVTWNYVQKILYRPIKTTLYKTGNYICIVNTPDHQMEFYDLEGNYSYKIGMKTDSILAGRWSQEILVDDATSRIYTYYIKNGIFLVYRIDQNTGSLKIVATASHPYPQKLRIYNNWLYYLYDFPGSPDNKIMFRQRF